MYVGDDGMQRWVVAHRDPGVQNWIDTTGVPRGFLSHRWAYAELPPKDERYIRAIYNHWLFVDNPEGTDRVPAPFAS